MAARALVPLISSDSIVSTVTETLKSCNPANQNELHGKLLQCQYLLRGHLHKRDSIELWTSFVREVPETLMAKLQDLIVLNECPMTVALLLDIILEFFIECDIFKTDSKDDIEGE
jgi:thyroid adenoma-associated protein